MQTLGPFDPLLIPRKAGALKRLSAVGASCQALADDGSILDRSEKMASYKFENVLLTCRFAGLIKGRDLLYRAPRIDVAGAFLSEIVPHAR
jgi:hypothetical protein